MASLLAGLGVHPPSCLWKHPLPLPLVGRARVLAVERIRSEYQREGHYEVRVDWEEQEPSDDLLRVIDIPVEVDFLAVSSYSAEARNKAANKDNFPG